MNKDLNIQSNESESDRGIKILSSNEDEQVPKSPKISMPVDKSKDTLAFPLRQADK